MKKRVPKKAPRPVQEWVKYLDRAASAGRFVLGGDEAVLLAALLTLVGPPTNPEAREAFHVLKGLLFQQEGNRVTRGGMRTARLRPALEAIPPTRDGLFRVVQATKAFCRITGNSVAVGNAKIDQVVRVMGEIPDPDPYVSRLYRQGFTQLGAVFHPNTLEQSKKALRGMFSTQDDYWNKTQDQLNVIRD